VKCFW